MLSEFELIQRYFTKKSSRTVLGIGDDCALIAPPPGRLLAISSDMLVEGRHFLPGANPLQLGHKALAVNLSDLAAMGATPYAFTLSLALPEAREEWLAPFSQGLLELAQFYECELIGGDTTKGPLTIAITVFGTLPAEGALRRDAAQVGDDIWISGHLGDARLALAAIRQEITLSELDLEEASPRMHRPTPRIALGHALIGLANAAIDISDGLLGDLGHILQHSRCGALLWVDNLPIGTVLKRQEIDLRREFSLNGGDDYELCLTAPPHQRNAILRLAQTCATPMSCVGHITSESGLTLLTSSGTPYHPTTHAFDHFLTP